MPSQDYDPFLLQKLKKVYSSSRVRVMILGDHCTLSDSGVGRSDKHTEVPFPRGTVNVVTVRAGFRPGVLEVNAHKRVGRS